MLILFFIQAISQRGGGRFVDDAQYFQTGNATSIFSGLALGIVEIGRNGDNGLAHRFAQISLSIGFKFLENHGADFRGRIFSISHDDFNVAIGRFFDGVRDQLDNPLDFGIVKLTPHEALNGKDSILGIDHRLTFGYLADHALVRFRVDGHH